MARLMADNIINITRKRIVFLNCVIFFYLMVLDLKYIKCYTFGKPVCVCVCVVDLTVQCAFVSVWVDSV